jgi:ferredoxin--NADP+ reductase
MSLRVAVVGTGPAGMYTVGHLLSQPVSVVGEISVLDRLPTPGGLVRSGVAPDHPNTKGVSAGFERSLRDSRISCYFNIEVGRDVPHAELVARHHAVVYAVGASGSRALGLDGEYLPGSHAAAEFVAWYNGHPDFSSRTFDLGTRRVVIVGAGNVALDIARILTLPVATLARTDIADHALAALDNSNVNEVVVLARGSAATAAFTSTELLALTQLDDVDVVVDADLKDGAEPVTYGDRLKLDLVRRLSVRTPRNRRRRIVLRFMTSVAEIIGDTAVEGVRVVRNATGDREVLETGLVLSAIGYRPTPIPGSPIDEIHDRVAHDRGRVSPGVYVAGWFKRGPTGVIGTNKYDAADTVATLLADSAAGLLDGPTGSMRAWAANRLPAVVGVDGWTGIDDYERNAAADRPRVKVTARAALLSIAERSQTCGSAGV